MGTTGKGENRSEEYDYWALMAQKRLLRRSEDPDKAAEALYNAHVTALRDGRYVELRAVMDRLMERRVEAFQRKREARELLGVLEGFIERMVRVQEKGEDAFWAGEQYVVKEVLPQQVDYVVLAVGLHALRPDPTAPWMPNYTLPHVSAEDMVAKVERRRDRLAEEHAEAMSRAVHLSFLTHWLDEALRRREEEVWPPLYEEVTWPKRQAYGPGRPRAPLSRDDVDFSDGRYRHRPFAEWIRGTYLYYLEEEEYSEDEALERTRRDYERAHGDMIRAEFPDLGRLIDPRTLKRYAHGE